MMSQHYICERCGGVARVVHHKVYITPRNINDLAITLDWENLEALCMDCHNAEHIKGGSYERKPACQEGLEFDANGNLVESSDLH